MIIFFFSMLWPMSNLKYLCIFGGSIKYLFSFQLVVVQRINFTYQNQNTDSDLMLIDEYDSNLMACDRKLSTSGVEEVGSRIVIIQMIKKITYFIIVKFKI